MDGRRYRSLETALGRGRNRGDDRRATGRAHALGRARQDLSSAAWSGARRGDTEGQSREKGRCGRAAPRRAGTSGPGDEVADMRQVAVRLDQSLLPLAVPAPRHREIFLLWRRRGRSRTGQALLRPAHEAGLCGVAEYGRAAGAQRSPRGERGQAMKAKGSAETETGSSLTERAAT